VAAGIAGAAGAALVEVAAAGAAFVAGAFVSSARSVATPSVVTAIKPRVNKYFFIFKFE
jgi:hypothetical protein